MTKDSPEVLQRIRDGQSWVEAIAKRLAREWRRTSPSDLDDFVADGKAGLLDVARRYDPEAGVSFRTYATPRIEGAIRDGYAKLSMSRYMAAKLTGGDAGHRALEAPADRERLLEKHLADMATAQADGHFAKVGLDTLGEFLPISSKTTPEDASLRSQKRGLIERCIGELTRDEAFVIRRHYFDEVPIEHVADELGYSRMKTRTLHERAREQLEKLLATLR